MDRQSRKAKRHQHLRRARQAVLYQTLCRPLSKRAQANDGAFAPSFGGCRVSQSTTPICAIAHFRVNAKFTAVGHHVNRPRTVTPLFETKFRFALCGPTSTTSQLVG